MQFSQKSKTLLKYSLIFIILIISLIRINIPIKSIYDINTTTIYSKIIHIKETTNKIEYLLKNKEKIIANCYECKNEFNIGDYVYIEGDIKEIPESRIFNIFSYKEYLKTQKIHYIFTIKDIKLIKKNKNIFYSLKQIIIKQIHKSKKTYNYLYAFILGNTSYLEVKDVYQINQTSHLFAISGMHLSLITMILLKILNKLKTKNLIVFIIIIIYAFLSNFSSSLVRAGLFFILLKLNKKHQTIDIFYLTISIILIINPYLIKTIGFQYSIIISYFLLISKKSKKKINKAFYISLLSFLASIPITINNFYEINILSIILNVIYVFFVSTIVFPLSLVTFFIPILDPILYFFIFILEKTSIYFSNIKFLILTIGKIHIIFILIYYIFLYLFITKSKKYIWVLILLIISFYFKNTIKNPEITFIDVGQGDSTLIQIKNNAMLVDTGGIYNQDYIGKNTISYIKSLGIKKLDYLVLTHGDLDHLGEAINILKKIKVKKVLFNDNNINYNEQLIINYLNKKNIEYELIKDEYTFYLNKYKFFVLNPIQNKNENDDSLVLYSNINNYNILITGDISKPIEEEIIKKYNLKIDILKVSHHGSKTSTSNKFIKEIQPKYSIIQAGENNKFKHPHQETLQTLEDSIICNTIKDYSIKIILKKNLKIITKSKNHCNKL